ncbi:hypothetical protein [Niabella sp.]|uniref:glycine-rich domain-containing protein n=1 Tax=Niabella sp. TaxID=1962976 RepID=UPI0026086056|nr:hypothetical protein [Niabella sp.]
MKSWLLKRAGIRSALVGSLSLLLATASAQTTYSTPGNSSFTPSSSGLYKIQVWGAGGQGGDGANSSGGGGGGAYSEVTIALAKNGVCNLVVGGGGNTANSTGGNSSFTVPARAPYSSFTVTANGGSSTTTLTGAAGGVAQASTSTWSTNSGTGIKNFAGGNGANGTNNTGGGGGGAADANGAGENGTGTTGGPTKGAGGGNGGDGAISGNSNGVNGNAPGGGGGGRRNNTNSTAGNGGNGRIVITLMQSLPVQFEAVAATVNGNDVTVNFTTLEEINNDHFNIQASENGTDFETIATVKSRHAGTVFTGATNYAVRIDKNGNTALLGLSALAVAALALGGARRNRKLFMSAVLGYVLIGMVAISCNKSGTAVDTEAGNRKAFIRIEQVDADGHNSYSKIIAVVKN